MIIDSKWRAKMLHFVVKTVRYIDSPVASTIGKRFVPRFVAFFCNLYADVAANRSNADHVLAALRTTT